MSIVKKTDHASEGVDTLAQYPLAESTALMALLEILLDQVQLIEDDAFDLWVQRNVDDLDSVAGVHLDVIGKIVGQPRWGRNDADYRTLIRCRIIANSTEGQVDKLLDVVALLLTDVLLAAPRYDQLPGPSFKITWIVTSPTSQTLLDAVVAFVKAMIPKGVEYALIEVNFTPFPAFSFDTTGAGFDQGKFGARRIL